MRQKAIFFALLIVFMSQFIGPAFCQDDESKANAGQSTINQDNISFIIGIAGFVITVASLAYSIYLHYTTKKERELNKVALEVLQGLYDKKNIENEIEHMKKQKDVYATENKKSQEELKLFREQIEKDLPKEARKAVLKGKINSLEETLLNTYDSLRSTRVELNEIENDVHITSEIEKMVEKEIRPEFLIKKEQDKFKNYLVFLTTAATLSSNLLHYPFSQISYLFLLIAIYPVLGLFRLQSHKISNNSKESLLKYIYIGSSATFAIIALFFTIVIYSGSDFSESADLSVIMFLSCIMSGFFYNSYRKIVTNPSTQNQSIESDSEISKN